MLDKTSGIFGSASSVHAEALAKHRAFENVDLTQYDLDGPLPTLEEVGVEGHYREVVEFAARERLTVRQIGTWYGARTEGDMIGSPVEIADRMQEWMDKGAADGFMIQATHLPGAFEDFASAVVPELQRPGLKTAGSRSGPVWTG